MDIAFLDIPRIVAMQNDLELADENEHIFAGFTAS
jgi:hypothetical protein